MYLTANRVAEEGSVSTAPVMEQLDLFTDHMAVQAEKEAKEAELARERKLQEAMLGIKSEFGKNAILRACLKSFDKNGGVGDNRKKQAGAGENASISK